MIFSGISSRPFHLLLAAAVCVFLWVMAPYLSSTEWKQGFLRENLTEHESEWVIGRDFLNLWLAGKAAWEENPERYYDIAQYKKRVEEAAGEAYPQQQWSYPPSILLLAAPFGKLSYTTAYGLWWLLGIGALLLALRGEETRGKLLLFLSPAAYLCFISGQNAFFTTAMILGAFRWLDRRPVAAGMLIGLLTIKPQLGLLFPIILLVSRRWKAMASAGITALLLAVATAALYGVEIWRAYLELGAPLQYGVLRDPSLANAAMMPTLFMELRIAGLSHETARAIHIIVALTALAAATHAFRRPRNPEWSFAIFAAASAIVTPYLMAYDFLPLTWSLILLMQTGRLDRKGWWIAIGCFWIPFLHLWLTPYYLTGAAFLLPLWLLWLCRSMERPS